MTEIEIYETGKKVTLPSSWAEMTPAQVQAVFRIHDQAVRKGWSILERNVRILYALLDIRPGWRKPTPRMAENVAMLCERCLGFIGEGLTFDALANPLPRAGRLHGPAELLQDLTFGEFRAACRAQQAFLKDHRTEDLDELAGILYRSRYRKENRAGRRAGPLSGRPFRRDLRRAARMKTWQKSLVLLWFCACLHYLQTGRLVLDGEEVDLSLLFKDSGESRGPAATWNDLLYQLAKDQTIGNIDRVEEEPLFSVLALMWSNYKEAKRYEETAKAGKGH
jgi:hypothetical protein